ncbi:MAG: hypothetical protein J6W00_10580 [Lentisphaeria bacterium]|nr:hypothetical protein [Lentisphaeria bacterium]
MSKHFGFIVVVIAFMALAANVTLFLRMGAAEKAIKQFEKLQIALPPELHKKIEKKLELESCKIADKMSTQTEEFANGLKNQGKKYAQALDEQLKNLKLQGQAVKASIDQSEALKASLQQGERQLQSALKRNAQVLAGQIQESRKDYASAMKSHQAVLQKQTNIMLAHLKSIEKKHSDQLNTHLKSLQKAADRATLAIFQKIREDNKREMQKIAANVALLAKQKIAGNELAAEEAFKTATALMKKGDFTSARLYCLNAINHAPNKKQYFDTLYRIIEANKSTNISELEQLRSVLELGLYQVDSKDIPAMTKMLATVVNKQEKISEKSAKLQSQNEKRQITEAIELLKNGGLAWKAILKESVEKAIPLLRERLNKLTNLTDRVSGNEAEFCNAEIKRSNALLEYSIAMYSINNALEKADQLLKSGKAVPAVNSMVQSANSVLGQAWNINFSYIPAECRSKLLGQADRIVILEKKFNEIKSRPAMAKINRIYDNSLNKLEGNCTRKIAALQAGMKQIMAQAAKVYDADKRREIEEKVKVLADKVKEYTKERYEGYQTWAVKQCENAFEKYKGMPNVFGKADYAKTIINDWLINVDTSLLTPAVSRLYQDILSKQFAALGWKDIAEMEQALATSSKKTIEDCPNEE